jgi:hypothetical protein
LPQTDQIDFDAFATRARSALLNSRKPKPLTNISGLTAIQTAAERTSSPRKLLLIHYTCLPSRHVLVIAGR